MQNFLVALHGSPSAWGTSVAGAPEADATGATWAGGPLYRGLLPRTPQHRRANAPKPDNDGFGV